MYGWVNGSLEDWVQTTYGPDVWQSIVKISQCEVPLEGFFRNVHYSDEDLFQLVRASSIILNLDCDQIIFAAGKQFIHYLERHGYSRTLRCQGSTFLEWLHNVNEPHRLLRSRFPKAMFPVLWVEEDTEYLNIEGSPENTVTMHYLSKHKDIFVPLFKGILFEAAKYYFNLEISIDFLSDEIVSSNPEFPEYHARFRLFLGKGKSFSSSIKDLPIVEREETLRQCPFHKFVPTPAKALSSSISNGSQLPTNKENSNARNHGSVGVSGPIFQHLFPFHLILDRSLNIIQMGNKLQELIDTKWHIPNVLNHPVNANFEFVTPKFIDWTWIMLQKLDKAAIEIALTTPLQKAHNFHGCGSTDNESNDHNNNIHYISPETISVRFRGEVILLDGNDADKIALCVNPDIPHIDYLYHLHMRLGDLPCHSFQAEMLLIDEHLKTETNYSLSLKEIGAELDRETKRATKALELKRHFVRYVSHEIRTPLNIAILGIRFMEYALAQQQQQDKAEDASKRMAKITNAAHAEEAEDDEDDESLPVVMNEVKSAVVIAVEILNDLLLYEKVDNSGFFELSPEFYDVHALIHESVSLFRVQAKGADVKFEVDDNLIVRAGNDGTLDLPCRLGHDFHHHFKKSPLSLSSALSSSMSFQRRQHHPPHSKTGDASVAKDKGINELESIIVKVDKSKTQQVLRNLFTNAVKFTSPGKSVKISYAVFGTPEMLDSFHAEQRQKASALEAQEEVQQRRLLLSSSSLEQTPHLMTDNHGSIPVLDTTHENENTQKQKVEEDENEMKEKDVLNDLNEMDHSFGVHRGLSSSCSISVASLASRPSVLISSAGDSIIENSIMATGDISYVKHSNEKDTMPKVTSSSEHASDVVVHFAEEIADFPPYFVRISVKDEGVGISDADQRTLFHEFIQLKAEKLQNGQGSGLGLWIASTIMHLHGGRIGVMSAGEGKGATFFIDLPIVVFEEEEQNDNENNTINDNTTENAEASLKSNIDSEILQRTLIKNPLPPAIIISRIHDDHEYEEEDAFSIHGSDDIFRSSSHASNKSKSLLPTLTVNTHVLRSPPISPAYRTPNDSFFSRNNAPGGSSHSSNSSNHGSVHNINMLHSTHTVVTTRSRSGSTPPHYFTTNNNTISPRLLGMQQHPSSASKYVLLTPSNMRTPRTFLPAYNNGNLMNSGTRMLFPLEHPCLESVRVLIVDDAASNRKMVKRLFQTKFKNLEDAENGKVAVEKYIQSLTNYTKLSSVSVSSSASQDKYAAGRWDGRCEPGIIITTTLSHNSDNHNSHNENNNSRNTNDTTDTTGKGTNKPPYGLILMDYLMPVMDGIEATRQIKQAAREHNVDVLVFGVTGQGLAEDVHMFKAVGADEVFMKPLDFTMLLACLQTTYHFS